MSLQSNFNKIDKKFAAFENHLKNPNSDQFYVLMLAVGDPQTIKNAAQELGKIRAFYEKRFEANTGLIAQAIILAEYDALYNTLYKITKNQISAENAREQIENDTVICETYILFKDIFSVCLGFMWLLPVAASLVILPFTLPFLSINPLLGVSLLMTCGSALILSLSQSINNFMDISSTSTAQENLLVELSFFSKMNSLFKPNGMDAVPSEDAEYDSERSYDIFA